MNKNIHSCEKGDEDLKRGGLGECWLTLRVKESFRFITYKSSYTPGHNLLQGKDTDQNLQGKGT